MTFPTASAAPVEVGIMFCLSHNIFPGVLSCGDSAYSCHETPDSIVVNDGFGEGGETVRSAASDDGWCRTFHG